MTPTPQDAEAVAQARADVLETMLHGNDTLVEYYGSAGDNGAWERDRERCKRENEAQLDALIAAVWAECAAKVPELEAEVERLRAAIADPVRWLTRDGDSVPFFMRPTPRTDG